MDPRIPRILDALGGDPSTVRFVRAPGRVNLIGDHTDYNDGLCLPMAIDRDCIIGFREMSVSNTRYNDGLCLPMAIDRDCVVATRPGRGDRIRAQSLDTEGRVDLPVAGEWGPVEAGWGRFVAAAVQVLSAQGRPVGSVELAVASTVPIGSGLSSSAALCVALVLALGGDPDGDPSGDAARIETARAAREVELVATGVPVGLMDQLVSVFGRRDAALLLDCRTLEVDPVPLPATLAVGVVHSGLSRALTSSGYAERRAACAAAARRLGVATLRDATGAEVEDDPIARHVVSENARVVDAAAALRRGDVTTLGTLMVASHASLRDDFEVSTPELNRLVVTLLDAGAIGARLTGAGFGGCVVAVTTPERRDTILADACDRYRAHTGLEPRAFPVRAVDGAGPLEPG